MSHTDLDAVAAPEVSKKGPEFEPPAASVARIVKNSLPSDIQLSKDAKAAFSRAAGIFIFYLTHCANEFKADSKRSTIQAVDVMAALKELDFGDLEGPIEEFMQLYKKEQKEEAAKKKAEKISKSSSTTDAGSAETATMAGKEGDAEGAEEETPEDNDYDEGMDSDP